MIRLAAFLSLIAAPLSADPFMTQDQCDGAWQRSVALTFGAIPSRWTSDALKAEREAAEGVTSELTADGWCAIVAQGKGLEDANFARLAWRAKDIDGFIDSNGVPSRVEVQFWGVRLEQAVDYEIFVAVQHVPDEGQLVIDNLMITSTDDANITASGVIGGAFFRDIGMAGMSLGGLHLDRLSVVADVTPDLVADLAPDLTGPMLKKAISQLSFIQMDQASQREVIHFADDLPELRGTLRFDFRSERGLGMMQFGMAQSREGADAVAFALSGATVAVDWQPR
ncbi:hypothetical protein [Yoonia sp. R2-816]|uniref:hypothetical protein n=1 Tax=Yoonia sp. R2-816 TaxID=3342638 RepID=UPI00372C21CC